uniref:CC domain-containing protein n=1 Tax=Syphacia muris TaxID=451379 RepID=A0A0N5AEV9_9BILA
MCVERVRPIFRDGGIDEVIFKIGKNDLLNAEHSMEQVMMNQIVFWLFVILCKAYAFPIQCYGNNCLPCTNANCQPCVGPNCFNNNYQLCPDGTNCLPQFLQNSNMLTQPCIGPNCLSSQINPCIGPNCASNPSCIGVDCNQAYSVFPQNLDCIGSNCNLPFNGMQDYFNNGLIGSNNFINMQPCFGTNCQPCNGLDCFNAPLCIGPNCHTPFNYDPCYGANCMQSASAPVVYKQSPVQVPIAVVQQPQPSQVVQYSPQKTINLAPAQPATQVLQQAMVSNRPATEVSSISCTGNNCSNPALKIVIPTSKCRDVECLINIICPNGKCTNLPKFDKRAKRSS